MRLCGAELLGLNHDKEITKILIQSLFTCLYCPHGLHYLFSLFILKKNVFQCSDKLKQEEIYHNCND